MFCKMSSKMQVIKILLVLCSILESCNCIRVQDGDKIDYQCETGKHLTTFNVSYHKITNDIIYELECTNSIPMGSCSWQHESARIPGVHMSFFECSNKGAISGIRSTYSSTYKDLVFSFKCCTISEPSSYRCLGANGNANRIASTEYINWIQSYYTGSTHKDRTFGIMVCRKKS